MFNIYLFFWGFFCIDKKENGNVIQYIYNIGFDYDDWSEVMDIFLVCKINGVYNFKIIWNLENYVE